MEPILNSILDKTTFVEAVRIIDEDNWFNESPGSVSWNGRACYNAGLAATDGQAEVQKVEEKYGGHYFVKWKEHVRVRGFNFIVLRSESGLDDLYTECHTCDYGETDDEGDCVGEGCDSEKCSCSCHNPSNTQEVILRDDGLANAFVTALSQRQKFVPPIIRGPSAAT